VALGFVIARRDRGGADPGPYRSRGLRTVQRATGAVALIFVLAHLSHTWLVTVGGGDAALVYDILRDELGRPAWLATYVIGLTCVCVHVAQGIGAAAKTWGLVSTEAGARVLRIVGVCVALALWVVSLNTLSHFAVGRALLFGADAPAEAAGDGGAS
jgi:succinate dehydrogenase hydrophobic anchor subunit